MPHKTFLQRRQLSGLFLWFTILVCLAATAQAQTPVFTYQGRLTDGAAAANGTYQMQFSLFDALSGGTQQGTTITNNSVTVTNGVFTVQLDFSPATPFVTGANRWLRIAVKKAAEPSYTTLTPRQQVTSSPYAIKSLSAADADKLGGLAANTYLQTNGNGSLLTNLNGGNITPGSVATDKIADGAVTTSKVGDGSVTQAKLAPGFLPTVRVSTSGVVLPGESVSVSVACPISSVVVGGGFQVFPNFANFVVTESYPFIGGDGWIVTATNTDAKSRDLTAWAICVQ